MSKWKLTFMFLTGFWLNEVLTHIWVSLEGLLPFTSKLFPWLTITNGLNTQIMSIDLMLTLIFAYLAFLHQWETRHHIEHRA